MPEREDPITNYLFHSSILVRNCTTIYALYVVFWAVDCFILCRVKRKLFCLDNREQKSPRKSILTNNFNIFLVSIWRCFHSQVLCWCSRKQSLFNSWFIFSALRNKFPTSPKIQFLKWPLIWYFHYIANVRCSGGW